MKKKLIPLVIILGISALALPLVISQMESKPTIPSFRTFDGDIIVEDRCTENVSCYGLDENKERVVLDCRDMLMHGCGQYNFDNYIIQNDPISLPAKYQKTICDIMEIHCPLNSEFNLGYNEELGRIYASSTINQTDYIFYFDEKNPNDLTYRICDADDISNYSGECQWQHHYLKSENTPEELKINSLDFLKLKISNQLKDDYFTRVIPSNLEHSENNYTYEDISIIYNHCLAQHNGKAVFTIGYHAFNSTHYIDNNICKWMEIED